METKELYNKINMTEDILAVQDKLKDIREGAKDSLRLLYLAQSAEFAGMPISSTLNCLVTSFDNAVKFCDIGIKECEK